MAATFAMACIASLGASPAPTQRSRCRQSVAHASPASSQAQRAALTARFAATSSSRPFGPSQPRRAQRRSSVRQPTRVKATLYQPREAQYQEAEEKVEQFSEAVSQTGKKVANEMVKDAERDAGLLDMPPVWQGVADDKSLHNPLERQNRLGTGWMGAVFEWEGVLVGEFAHDHSEAWLQLAEEEGKSPPLAFNLKRAEGMKSEQVVTEVFCWTRNPMDVRRLANRKLEIFLERLSAKERDSEARKSPPYEVSEGVVNFLENLLRNEIPCAVGCSAPAMLVEDCIEELGLSQYFAAVVTGDDVERGRPDPDSYVYAAQALGRVPARCVVIGNSNSAIEAAHDAGMKCVAIQSASKPAYELSSADLVVRQLDELSLVNLKQLFRQEDLDALNTMEPGMRHPSFGPSGGYSGQVAPGYYPEPELQMELEKEEPKRRQYTDFDDW